MKKVLHAFLALISLLIGILAAMMISLLLLSANHERPMPAAVRDSAIMDNFDAMVRSRLQEAEDTVLAVPKKFWLPDDADKGRIPDPECYGSSGDPSELGWLLEEASVVLDGQATVFSTETVLKPGTKATYYLDDSIFAVTWKQIMGNFVYTISEVKITDPSQFKRYLAGNQYNSKELYITTEMAQQVNAVVASSADYYRGREFGIIVYDGEVKRVNKAAYADVCYIDKNGDLHFSYRGQLMDKQSAQNFVDEHDIQFSISFGPVLIDDGVRCEPKTYPLGEVNDRYARAALCQMDELHYLVVAANSEIPYANNHTIHDLAEHLTSLGCQKAYTMDGGNTAAIAMDGKLINKTAFGYQRRISDIIYFATAVPEKGE